MSLLHGTCERLATDKDAEIARLQKLLDEQIKLVRDLLWRQLGKTQETKPAEPSEPVPRVQVVTRKEGEREVYLLPNLEPSRFPGMD